MPLVLFICHPSDLLTDSLPHGDGLLADQFIRQLALRGHSIHVAVGKYCIERSYPSNVFLHKINSKSETVYSRAKYTLEMRALLRKLQKTIKFDLIHQLNPVVTGVGLGLMGIDIPIVMGPYVPEWPANVNNGRLEAPRIRRRLANTLKKEIWNLQHTLASAIIMSTPAALSKVTHPLKLQSKLHFIPFGIDTDLFAPKGLPERPTVLFVGHVKPYKGVFVLAEAFQIVHRHLPEVSLLIAGTGSEADLRMIKASLGVAGERVRFLGHVDRTQIPRILNECTVFCLPSYGEAFGLSALEAMASGRPVVGTDAGGLAHLISDEGGRKVRVGDSGALANALLEVLTNASLAREMSTHNRRLAEEKYSWSRVIDRLEAVYGKVAAKGDSRRAGESSGGPHAG